MFLSSNSRRSKTQQCHLHKNLMINVQHVFSWTWTTTTGKNFLRKVFERMLTRVSVKQFIMLSLCRRSWVGRSCSSLVDAKTLYFTFRNATWNFRYKWVRSSAIRHLFVNAIVCTLSFAASLPVALALFPQESTVSLLLYHKITDRLECWVMSGASFPITGFRYMHVGLSKLFWFRLPNHCYLYTLQRGRL